jgi:hypothetical protein
VQEALKLHLRPQDTAGLVPTMRKLASLMLRDLLDLLAVGRSSSLQLLFTGPCELKSSPSELPVQGLLQEKHEWGSVRNWPLCKGAGATVSSHCPLLLHGHSRHSANAQGMEKGEWGGNASLRWSPQLLSNTPL